MNNAITTAPAYEPTSEERKEQAWWAAYCALAEIAESPEMLDETLAALYDNFKIPERDKREIARRRARAY